MTQNKTYKPSMGANAPPNLRDLVPHSYLLRVTPITCNHCGAKHQSIETFLVRYAPALTSTTGFRQLTPVESMSMKLSVGVTTLQPKAVAFCTHCFTTVPDADPMPHSSPEAWTAALRADARKTPSKPAKPAEPLSARDIDF